VGEDGGGCRHHHRVVLRMSPPRRRGGEPLLLYADGRTWGGRQGAGVLGCGGERLLWLIC
jgi:hypothetical protein